MNKLFPILLSMILLPALYAQPLFSKVSGIDHARIQRVAFSPSRPAFMAVASENALYTSTDHGNIFLKIAVFKDEQISHLLIENSSTSTLYLAGTRHCYKISSSQEKIFSAQSEERIHSIATHQGHLYVATSKGLYHTDSSLLNWKTVPGLRNTEVYSIEGFGKTIYLACDSGIYHFQPSTQSLRRTFTTRGNTTEKNFNPLQIQTDPLTPTRLWMGANKGIYQSNNRGENWQKFYTAGADHIAVNCLRMAPLDSNHFYICTAAGFYKIDITQGTSTPLYEGLTTSKINWMDFSADGTIYLATDQGLFKETRAAQTTSPKAISLQDLMKGEPSIHEIQEAALHYNSVHPDKVRQWSSKLKYRALAPTLSVDYDNTIRGGSKDGIYRFAEGPSEWGVSLSWDLDELIWSPYETSIDNRNKLATQLRSDILDDINRIYFERLRLKRELMLTEARSDELYTKELRLYELTATLDGYTGGFFSKKCAAL